MATAVHCDRPLCETWAASHCAAEFGFLRLTWGGHGYDFCSADHAMQFLSSSAPLEEIK